MPDNLRLRAVFVRNAIFDLQRTRGRLMHVTIADVERVLDAADEAHGDALRRSLKNLLSAAEHTHRMGYVTAALDAGIADARATLGISPSVEELATDIRAVDGDHALGASQLTEELLRRGWTRKSEA